MKEKKQASIMRERKVLYILNANPSPFFVKLSCTFQDLDRLCILNPPFQLASTCTCFSVFDSKFTLWCRWVVEPQSVNGFVYVSHSTERGLTDTDFFSVNQKLKICEEFQRKLAVKVLCHSVDKLINVIFFIISFQFWFSAEYIRKMQDQLPLCSILITHVYEW